ncbi:hypothetical protein [Corallococcus macrosporus]|uniref:Putative lipoprotein n=1 Tax=Myxococcus fulvus (strain ATCC BAA-855 / HW-1) TaxID=483219 RepID=F8CEG3_MYXFH|nr:hypothetical protein [Corallococcus macrosporus]AEI64833.1 putative lipoprotein [Corallococcus macrosporus]
MRTTSFRTLLLSGLALLTTGCESLFFIEAEAEEICKTERDLSFPAALPLTVNVERSFTFPLGDIADPLPEETDVETELRLRLFEVTADTDLSVIEHASVSVRQPGSTGTHVIGEYTRTSTAPTQTIQLTSTGAVDLLDLAREPELEFIFKARGALPTEDWSATVRACAGVKAQANYFDLVF